MLEASGNDIHPRLHICPARLDSQLQLDSDSVLNTAHLTDLMKMRHQRDKSRLFFLKHPRTRPERRTEVYHRRLYSIVYIEVLLPPHIRRGREYLTNGAGLS